MNYPIPANKSAQNPQVVPDANQSPSFGEWAPAPWVDHAAARDFIANFLATDFDSSASYLDFDVNTVAGILTTRMSTWFEGAAGAEQTSSALMSVQATGYTKNSNNKSRASLQGIFTNGDPSVGQGSSL